MKPTIYTSRELAAALPTLIGEARHSLRVAMYQLAPETSTSTARMRALWAALREAPRRGVLCSAVLHAGSRSLPGMEAANMTAAQLEAAGWRVRLITGGQIMHAKVAVIDLRTVLIGSHNWTESGLYQNDEASVVLDNPDLAADLTAWISRMMTRD